MKAILDGVEASAISCRIAKKYFDGDVYSSPVQVQDPILGVKQVYKLVTYSADESALEKFNADVKSGQFEKECKGIFFAQFAEIFGNEDVVHTAKLPIGVADGDFSIPEHFGYRVIATWKSGGRGNNDVLCCKPNLSYEQMLKENIVEILKNWRFSNDGDEFILSPSLLTIKSRRVGSWVGKGGWRIKAMNAVFPTKVI